MIYRDKYFHDNIIMSIFAYRDNRADDNIVDTINIKSLSPTQCSGCDLECVVPLAASALPL